MRILITGATGLVGREIIRQCHENNISVNYLTTDKDKIKKIPNCLGFYWNPEEDEMDPKSLESVGAIIHLAGSSIFKRWNESNRQEMIASRVNGAKVLFKTLQETEHVVGHFISASGISVYPSSFKKMYYEDEPKVASTFLGELVKNWEEAANNFSQLGLRVAKVRTGIVLSNRGGALLQMQRPLKYNLGAALGNGKQWQSWIHIEDLARMYVFIVTNGLEGVYNAAAPDPVTNKDLVREIAKVEGKKLVLPNVPAFGMKLVMGEMASIALESQLVASEKIQSKGFKFYYVNVGKALKDLKGKRRESQ